MSYQSPAARRPIKRRRDNTPLFLAIVTFMALPALGYAVYKLVINKPPKPAEDPYALAAPMTAPAAPASQAPAESERIKLNVPTTGPATTFQPGTIFNASSSPGTYSISSGGNGSSAAAVGKAWGKIVESVGVRKSLVIWLFDSTSSCDARREEVAAALESAYPSLAPSDESTPAPASAAPAASATGSSPAGGPATVAAKPAGPAAQSGGTDGAKLLTVVARYGTDVEYLTPAPTDDQESIFSALRTLKSPGTGNIENTFGAIEKAVAKFAEYAGPPHLRNICVVVVTDEVGNDQAVRDATADVVQKASAKVYVVGQSATFGSVGNQSAGEGKEYFQGPESREVEQPPLDGQYGMSAGGQECGFGPYSLVHLCRVSGGEYYAIAGMMMGGASIPPQYMPRYMSEKEYQAYRNGNKAVQALIAAAKEAPATPFSASVTSFTVDEAGAPVVREIDMAQRPVALILPAIETQFAKLKEGEGDRDKLIEPRQKAAYDLAMGRAMAMLVRAKGYNVLLAAFKSGGRKATKPDTRVWTLNQGEGIEKDSILSGMSKKAREYLERVIKEHPGTQWANAAQQELTTPIGWVWSES
jgi:hypothetical protein